MKFNAKTQQQRIAADQAIEDIERSNALNSSASLRAAFFHRQDAKVWSSNTSQNSLCWICQ
eukprot:m.87643 g.87643  ORF g.87643 m.87643 type:complete len:61 (-) comp16413_c0_seq3:428-610(-)